MENEHSTLTPEALLGEADFIRSVARRLVYDPAHAEDVAQEAWVAALRRPPAAVHSLRGWLTAVIRNIARRRHRTEQRRTGREADSAAPAAPPGPAEVAEREESRARVVEAVMALEPTYRDVVLLRDFEGLPPREIAQRLGISPGAVSTRLTRAHAKLREQLDALHGGDGRVWMLALLALCGYVGTADAAVLTSPEPKGGLTMPIALKAGVVVGVVVAMGVSGSLLWGHSIPGEVTDPGDAELRAASTTASTTASTSRGTATSKTPDSGSHAPESIPNLRHPRA
jgi:RNA polymerase sigma factor (sigma-70 family)